MKYLAFSVPGFNNIKAPGSVPTGGIQETGGKVISVSIQLLLSIAIILSLFYLIYGGYKWMSSAGDQEKLAQARLTLTYAIAGLIIAFMSFLIIQTIGKFIGANLLTI